MILDVHKVQATSGDGLLAGSSKVEQSFTWRETREPPPICAFWSLPFLMKPPVFSHAGSALMMFSNPNYHSKASSLNSILGFSFHLLVHHNVGSMSTHEPLGDTPKSNAHHSTTHLKETGSAMLKVRKERSPAVTSGPHSVLGRVIRPRKKDLRVLILGGTP